MKQFRNLTQHKLRLAALIFNILLCSVIPSILLKAQSSYSCPSICRTNNLNIGTGWDHEADTMYKYQQQDQYWKITRAPNTYNIDEMTNPGSAICAYSGIDEWNNWPPPLTGTFKNTQICINPFSPTLASAGNKQLGNCAVQSGQKAYWYERRISICADTMVQIGFYFKYTGDDATQGIDLIGNTSAYFATLSTGCQEWPDVDVVDTTLWLNPGEYTIRAVVLNAYGSYSPPSGTSSHKFQLGGYVYNVSVSDNFLVDNKHFGKSVGICAPVYPPSPYFQVSGPSCIHLPNVTDTFFVSNYHDSTGQNTYTLLGNNLAPFVPFGTDSAYLIVDTGQYTIISSDKYGCSWDTTFTFSTNPLLQVTPDSQCINGTVGQVTLATSPKPWNQMGFIVNSAPAVGYINPVIGLQLGINTIIAVDNATGCQSYTDTIRIGQIPQQILTSATPPCVPSNQVSTLWAWGLPVYTPTFYTYQFTSPTNVALTNVGWFTANTLPGVYGDYIVKVTEPYVGCSALDTITIYPVPEPNLVLTSSAGCVSPFGTVTITATPGVPGNYMYQLNGGTPQASNQFVVNASGTYNINVVAAGNCPSAPASIYIGNCGSCISGNTANAQWYNNINSSAAFPTTITPTTPIVIDGTLTVDSNLSILNNPNVYFTLFSKLEMQQQGTPIVLTIENSTLKPCYWWWAGVFADNEMESIAIDSSHFEWMSIDYPNNGGWYDGGVNVKNNAMLHCTNSTFKANNVAINVSNVTGNYAAQIENNIFEGSSTNPTNGSGVTGIAIRNVSNLQVGVLSQLNSGNLFRNLPSGIEIHSGNMNSVSNIKLYNNRFNNIRYSGGNAMNEYERLNGVYTPGNFLGTAIMSHYSNGNIDLTVENLQNDPQLEFINCDKGIVTHNTTLTAKNLIMQNVMLGMMNRTQKSNKYTMDGNYIDNSHIGIQVLAPQYAMGILNNTVNTRTIPIDIPAQYIDPNMPWITKKAPIGIDVSYTNTLDVQANKFINDNIVSVNTIGGLGIRMHNGHAYTSANENVVQFNTNSIASTSDWDIAALQGLQIVNCSGSTFIGNYVYGIQNPTVWQARHTLGLAMMQSPKCVLNCNKVKYAKFGLYGWGYNETTDDAVKYNKMNATEFPWLFLDFGSAFPASLGNVGDAANDNGNEFVSTANPLNWMGNAGMNLNQYKVFRWSNVPTNEWIYTDPNILAPNESGASTGGAEYQVQIPSNPPNDPCADPFFITVGNGDNGVDSTEIAQAIDIAQDSVSYLSYPEVGEWMAKYRLYQTLGTDSALLQSDPDLVYFYNQTQATLMEDIRYTDYLIALLSDSSTHSGNYAQRYTDAVNANNAIANGELWEMNEHEVNNLRLKLIAGNLDTIGYDTLYVDSLNTIALPRTEILNATEKQWLRSLAYTCAFVGGNAVYKARTLWSMYESDAKYDDRWLCINAQNKGGSPIQDIDSFLNNQLKENISSIHMTIPSSPIIKGNTKPLSEGDVVVYPNPTQGQINIEYKCEADGEFKLYNNLGQVILQTILNSKNNKVSLLTNELTTGVYTYVCTFENCESKKGKITVIK